MQNDCPDAVFRIWTAENKTGKIAFAPIANEACRAVLTREMFYGGMTQ